MKNRNIYNFSSLNHEQEENKIKIMIVKLFSKNLKELRLLHKYTQQYLSELSNLHPKYISELEQGRKIPSLLTDRKLAEVFGIKTLVCGRNCPFITIIEKDWEGLENIFKNKTKEDIGKIVKIIEVFFE